jgi:hypothetical protein
MIQGKKAGMSKCHHIRAHGTRDNQSRSRSSAYSLSSSSSLPLISASDSLNSTSLGLILFLFVNSSPHSAIVSGSCLLLFYLLRECMVNHFLVLVEKLRICGACCFQEMCMCCLIIPSKVPHGGCKANNDQVPCPNQGIHEKLCHT